MSLLRGLVRLLLRDYSLYRVYEIDAASPPSAKPQTAVTIVPGVDAVALKNSSSQILSGLSGWGGQEAHGYTLAKDGVPLAVCWYWYGTRYLQKRNFWPLRADEAKLVELRTHERARGAGHATALIVASTLNMFERGFTRLYARVWHSNEASLRAFEKAGWRNVAFVVELRMRGFERKWRFDLRQRLILR